MVNTVKFEDSLPTLSITPGTYCTLGVALVKSLGFTPTIQLIYGEPLVVPEESVIASRVWEFTSLDYEVQTETPFIYDSLLDPSWKPLHLRGLLGTTHNPPMCRVCNSRLWGSNHLELSKQIMFPSCIVQRKGIIPTKIHPQSKTTQETGIGPYTF